MNCKNCGAQILDGDKFCSECGMPISEATPPSENTQNEPNSYQKGKFVTKNIVLGTDGKYHWSYRFRLLKNPTILFLLWKMFFWIYVGIFIMVNLFDIFGGHFKFDRFLDFGGKFALILLGFEAFVALGYFIYAAIMGFTYYVVFEMDEKGVTHTQMPKQFKKAQAISLIEFFVGLSANNPSIAGGGLLAATKQSMHSQWDKVKSIEIFAKRGVIKVNSTLNYNQVYAEDEDFDFVKDYIKVHVSKKCKIQDK